MRSPILMIVVMGTITSLTLATATADAQRIQRFDDQVDSDGESAGVVMPGAPAPEQPEPEIQYVDPPGDGEAEDEQGDEVVGSYRISVHGQSGAAQTATPELLSRDHTELYRGVIPGERDEVEHLEQIKEQGKSTGQPNPITWVGFQPEEDRTRVFFQSPRPVQYQLQEALDEGELVVLFSDAVISDRNFSRFIDATHFNRAVKRIETEETRDGSVKVVLTMNEDLEPSISTEGEYLYLDFPYHGDSAGSRAESD